MPGTTDQPTPAEEPNGLQPNSVPRILNLSRGRASERYQVRALDPPTHTYTVRIVANGSPNLAMWFTTSYRAKLGVVESTVNDPSCRVSPTRTLCLLEFPALEAQRAGAWTMNVIKRSDPPTTLTITVAFSPIEDEAG